MSYPRNAATPPIVAVGAIYLLADGTIQTTGASVRVKTGTGSWGSGSGTLACDTDSGIWTYAPTQAETDAESFIVGVYKSASTSAQVTVATSASATAGYSGVDWSKVTAATTTVNLSGTTISTTQQVASVSGSVGSVTGAVGSVTGAVASVTARVTANVDQWNGVTVTGMPMPTYTQPTGFLAATFPATVSSYAGGAVASVTAAVTVGTNNDKTGYSLTVTPPTANEVRDAVWNAMPSATYTDESFGDRILISDSNQRAVKITGGGSGHIAADVHAFQTDVLTDAAIATSAVTKLQSGLATAENLLIANDRIAYALTALVGACSDAQTAAETYTLAINGNTFTVDYAGLDASGKRGTTTLTKA